ncbi:hypothetical protein SShM2_179 [Synechococcus phage S-ShM2]|uniref:Uncharacterized protein n=3 Tax=Ahtivirus sagseatwo TaxID=2734079 RepID=A0A1D7SIZ6_9CAUD|nr:hypothetical protein SShM2_179 [Synechococcus phage S-ShM2]AGH57385.1 hypothetical protein CPLG_00131 [Cyanophage S-SSM2]AOO13499.1 hypothetical protein LIS110610_169 [Cyanophage S-RIM14]ADO97790.1 hypothetical protein SShM2_179 [Synechococcus phage S-ShM2]AOO13931.1 hypothetical protein Np450711_169 [Cyanophage S-RIM14]AOO14147.1 hypothetical protein RW030110_169 [Cyanophage S-RIM14]
MATMFNLPLADAKRKAPTGMKKAFAEAVKGIPDKDFFFADSNWNGGRAAWSIKVSEQNLNHISDNINVDTKTVSGKAVLDYVIGTNKVRFLASNKRSAKSADAKTTAMQERASAWIMKRAISDNVRYKSWTDIKLDKKYPELEKIYPGVEEEWLKVFFAQQEKMLDEFSGARFDEYNRDGGFMDYVSNLVKSKFGVSKKDTWNPADIWLIKDQAKIEKIINETVAGGSSQTIQELNAVMRKMFRDRDVVGISLKKVSGNTARYEEYNVQEDGLDADYNYDVTELKVDLSLKSNNREFNTQDCRIVVEGQGSTFNFQIKGNDSTKLSNLKWEPTQKGATAARVGKAPVDMVLTLLKDNKVDFSNKYQDYPQNSTDFAAAQDEYKRIFNKLRTKSIDMGVSNAEEFIENMTIMYGNAAHVAVSKCMQMKFLAEVSKMKPKQQKEFMTDMVFIAAKKGSRFGPFGKLY